MHWIRSFIAQNPKRALVLGKTIFLAGSILVVGAVFARAALGNVNAARADAKLPAFRTLAQAYPQYPTWLVPEGAVGFSIAGALVLVGLGLTVAAEKAGKR